MPKHNNGNKLRKLIDQERTDIKLNKTARKKKHKKDTKTSKQVLKVNLEVLEPTISKPHAKKLKQNTRKSNVKDEHISEDESTEVDLSQPTVFSKDIEEFLADLEQGTEVTQYKQDLSQCLLRLQSSVVTTWNMPSVVLRAINDAIVRRKWDNVTNLLLILLQHSKKYWSYVRYVCHIMDKLNPAVQELGIQNQFCNIRSR